MKNVITIILVFIITSTSNASSCDIKEVELDRYKTASYRYLLSVVMNYISDKEDKLIAKNFNSIVEQTKENFPDYITNKDIELMKDAKNRESLDSIIFYSKLKELIPLFYYFLPKKIKLIHNNLSYVLNLNQIIVYVSEGKSIATYRLKRLLDTSIKDNPESINQETYNNILSSTTFKELEENLVKNAYAIPRLYKAMYLCNVL